MLCIARTSSATVEAAELDELTNFASMQEIIGKIAAYSAEIIARRDLDAVTQSSYNWAFWCDKNRATGEINILLAIPRKRCTNVVARSVLCNRLRKDHVGDRRGICCSQSYGKPENGQRHTPYKGRSLGE